MNEGRANLYSTSCAIHAESTTSVVLRPGSFFKYWAIEQPNLIGSTDNPTLPPATLDRRRQLRSKT